MSVAALNLGPGLLLRAMPLFQAAPSSPALPANPATPLAPAWLVLPLAIVTLLVVAAHMHAVHAPEARVPRSRRVIRSINAALMLVTVPSLAYAFGIVTPARQQAFVLAWTGVILLLALIILVAMIDVFNTWRLHASDRKTVKSQISALRLAMARQAQRDRAARANDAGAPPPPSGNDHPPARPNDPHDQDPR